MIEISPVLAGTYNQANSASGSTNLQMNTAATEDADGVDARRYTKFDRSAAESGSTTDFSFDDFLDLINPLEHIPLVSSAYRAITGEQINPVSRVAGDILYGAATGGVSALAGGAGAIGDTLLQAQTGKSAMQQVASFFFGDDDDAGGTQVASTATPAATAASPSAAASPASSSAVSAITAAAAATTPATATATAQAAAGTIPLSTATPPLLTAKSYPLANNKLPYGGVMDTGNSLRAQDMAMALSSASPTLRLGNTIYTGRLMTGTHLPPAATQAVVPAGGPATPNAAIASQQQLPQGLMDDIMALKAINQYKNTAAGAAAAGTTVNVTN